MYVYFININTFYIKYKYTYYLLCLNVIQVILRRLIFNTSRRVRHTVKDHAFYIGRIHSYHRKKTGKSEYVMHIQSNLPK